MAFGLQLCFVVIALGLIQEGESLRCFLCTSSLKGHCDDPLNSTLVKIQECSRQHNACLLLNVTSNGVSEIRRECADADYCSEETRKKRQVTIYSRSCRTCSWSLCNSSPSIAPSFTIGIAGLVLAKYCYF